VRRLVRRFPRRRIRPPEAVDQLDGVLERQVGRRDLERHERDVDVVEEDEAQPRDLELDRLGILPQPHAHRRDVVAAENVQARGRLRVRILGSDP
jgi:hypothetical protein